jgi:hypothetical protein
MQLGDSRERLNVVADTDDEFHDQVLSMADRLRLKGNDRRKYVHDHMTRGGYRMEPTYVPADDDDDDDDDDTPFFGKSKRSSSRSRKRDDDDDRPKPKRRGGSDDWYS